MGNLVGAPGCRFNANGIPDELKALPRWVRFDLSRDARGKLTKTPRIPSTNAEASNTNPRHWRPFDVAVADALARDQFVGFVFDRSLPFVFIDKDNSLGANGSMSASAARVVDTLCAPTERSASGRGLHVFCRGELPERIAIPADLRPIEVYPLRGARFCVMTGDLLPVEGNLAGAVPDRSAELAALFPAVPPCTQLGNASRNGALDVAVSEAECEAIVAWAAPFWTDGRRHHLALFMAGYLGKQGVSREQAVAIISACAAHDGDPAAKVAACHDTYDDLEAGAAVGGWKELQRVCGLTRDDLVPLDALLAAFWQRTHPRLILGGRLRVGHHRLRVREVARA